MNGTNPAFTITYQAADGTEHTETFRWEQVERGAGRVRYVGILHIPAPLRPPTVDAALLIAARVVSTRNRQ